MLKNRSPSGSAIFPRFHCIFGFLEATASLLAVLFDGLNLHSLPWGQFPAFL